MQVPAARPSSHEEQTLSPARNGHISMQPREAWQIKADWDPFSSSIYPARFGSDAQTFACSTAVRGE
jgi:hypothetical protein